MISSEATHLCLSDSQVNFDGIQHSHPVGAGLASCRLLAVHVEKNGQEVLGEAAHFSLFFVCRHKEETNITELLDSIDKSCIFFTFN